MSETVAQPVSYEYKPEIGVPGPQVGFIAEEMQIIDPRLVVLDASSTPFTVRYENLTAILAKASQEIAAKLDDLSNVVAASAHKFTTHELCVDDVCVTRDQFLRMVEQSENGQTSSEQGSVSAAPPISPPAAPEAEETNELEESDPAPEPVPADQSAE
jgi:hypothetical protein